MMLLFDCVDIFDVMFYRAKIVMFKPIANIFDVETLLNELSDSGLISACVEVKIMVMLVFLICLFDYILFILLR